MEELAEFEAIQHIVFIQSVLREAMHCNEVQSMLLQIMQTPSFKKRKSLDSVATVGWVC